LWAERQQRRGCAGSIFAGWPAKLPWHRCSAIELDLKINIVGVLGLSLLELPVADWLDGAGSEKVRREICPSVILS
jgi:hypothetical protein